MRLPTLGLLLSCLQWSPALATAQVAGAPPTKVTVEFGKVIPLPGKSARPAEVATFLYADTKSNLGSLNDSPSTRRIYAASLLQAFSKLSEMRNGYPDARIGEQEWSLVSFDIQPIDQTTVLAHLVSDDNTAKTARLHFVREDDEWKVNDIDYVAELGGSLRWEIESVLKNGDLRDLPLPHGLYDDGDGCGAAEITSSRIAGDASIGFDIPNTYGATCTVRTLSRLGKEVAFESACEEGNGRANHTWKVRSSIELISPTAFSTGNRTYRFCGSHREPDRHVGETLPLMAGSYSRPGGTCGGIAYFWNPNAGDLGSTFGGPDMQLSSCSPDWVRRDGNRVSFTTSCVPDDDGAYMDVNRDREIDLRSSTAFRFQGAEYKLCKRMLYDAPARGVRSDVAAAPEDAVPIGYDSRTNRYGGEEVVPYTHNGSYVMVFPKHGVIAYYQPRPSLQGIAKEGDLIFRGRIHRDAIDGTAYLYKKGCPPVGYPVRGDHFDETGVFTLHGRAPVHAKGSCEVVGTASGGSNATLVFEPGSGGSEPE